MRQFVDEDILQALRQLLDEFEVQPDATVLGVACAPKGEWRLFKTQNFLAQFLATGRVRYRFKQDPPA